MRIAGFFVDLMPFDEQKSGKFCGDAIVNRLEHACQKVADWSIQRPILFLLCLSFAFLWPTLLNSGPYYFGDSEGYLRGGRLALMFAGDLLTGWFGSASDDGSVESATSGIYGVRSVAYAVFAYLGRWPGDSILLATWIQSVLVIFILDTFFGQVGIRERAPKVVLGIWAVLLFLTPTPWFAAFVMPDIFAGISILGIGLLTVYQSKIHIVRRLVISGLIFFSVMAHLSMIPILALLGVLSGLVFLLDLRRIGFMATAMAYSWVAVPIGLGLAASMAVNMVGFDEPSVTGKRYPILLARSIGDGPAHWYLTEACAEGADYTVCELYPENDIPPTAGEFLWEPGGIRDIATPEQVQRIREEESAIVEAALKRYPFVTIRRGAYAAVRQLFDIGLADHRFDIDIVRTPDGNFTSTVSQPERLAWKVPFRIIFLAGFGASILILVWLIRSKGLIFNSQYGRLMLIVGGGILINAAICGALSAVTDRYQGRVVWVFTVTVLVVAWDFYQSRNQTKGLGQETTEAAAHT